MHGYHAGRISAIAVGALILAANTEATIAAHGLTGPAARTAIALALGVVAAACLTGAALRQGRVGLAFLLMTALAAGEAWNALSSLERVIETREARGAPARTAENAHRAATERLAAAERAVEAAAAAIAASAAEKGCARHCRGLLEGQQQTAVAELDQARQALAATPASAVSATPLADRLRIDAATIDLVSAVLASLAINGLAIGLIAFGAHATFGEPSANRSARAQPAAEAFGEPFGEATVPRTEARKRAVLAAILTDQAMGKPFASQRAAAERFDVAPSTLSEWFKEWEAAGIMPKRRTIGRCKTLS